jgi:hypothetical protein
LQNEAKSHWFAWPVDQVPQDAKHDLHRNAVSEHASHEQQRGKAKEKFGQEPELLGIGIAHIEARD